MPANDTSPDAQAAQTAAWRRLGRDGRLRLAVEMSEDARAIALEGIRRRHPELSEEDARRVMLRALYGDALMDRVYAGR